MALLEKGAKVSFFILLVLVVVFLFLATNLSFFFALCMLLVLLSYFSFITFLLFQRIVMTGVAAWARFTNEESVDYLLQTLRVYPKPSVASADASEFIYTGNLIIVAALSLASILMIFRNTDESTSVRNPHASVH